MDEKRSLIESTVRSCTSRLGDTVTEEQIQSMINRLVEMKDIKDVVDFLALKIDKFFGRTEQKEQYEACIKDLLELAGESYKSKEDIIAKIQDNKSKNYTPGNISVEENHQLIKDSLKPICDKLNELGVDYYLVGALSTFIGTKTPLFRYHSDIDFMLAEKDIKKVREVLAGTDYDFSDDRFNNQKTLFEEIHTKGEHEVIAKHKENEFHLGFFLFRREPDQSMTIREYFMQEENGKKVPMVLERNCPKELVDLEYTSEEIEFAGTKFRTATPESVYAKKMYTRNDKDMLDIEVLKDKVDESKIEEAKKYKTTLKIVEAIKEKTVVVEDVLSSAIKATEETTRISTINQQAQTIRNVQKERTQQQSIGNNEIDK